MYFLVEMFTSPETAVVDTFSSNATWQFVFVFVCLFVLSISERKTTILHSQTWKLNVMRLCYGIDAKSTNWFSLILEFSKVCISRGTDFKPIRQRIQWENCRNPWKSKIFLIWTFKTSTKRPRLSTKKISAVPVCNTITEQVSTKFKHF